MRRYLLLIAPLLIGTLSAQNINFTINSFNAAVTGKNQTYTSTFISAVAGTASFTNVPLPNQVANVTITNGTITRQRGLGCDGAVQMTIKFTFDLNNTLTVFAYGAVPAAGTAATLNFYVTGGTGSFQTLGGSGTINGTLNSQTGVISGSGSGTLGVNTPPPPQIAPSGIVPVFSSVPIIQPASWISIYGTFSTTTAQWNGDFPTKLGGVSVTVDNKPAYLWFVSPTQLNVQAPDSITSGCVNVAVTTANGTATQQVMLQPAQPSFSLYDGTPYAIGEIITPDGTGGNANGTFDFVGPVGKLVFPSRPAKVGETVQLFAVGLGPTKTPVPAGQVDSIATLNPTTYPVTVSVGGKPAQVTFAGEIIAGLYQINIVVPNVPSGDNVIVATVGAPNPVLFSSFSTQNCQDSDPQGANPMDCNVYLTVR